jgi:tRNA nucleotidyltransferase (CCA-adding enzyme)
VAQLQAEARLQVIEACDSFRRPERLLELIHVAQAWQAGHCGWSQPLSHTLQPWMHSLQAARSVDAQAIAQRSLAQDARPIPQRLHAERCAAIAKAMAEVASPGSSKKHQGGHRDVV